MDPWEFGWDALVAIGTLTLAAVTGVLACVTSRMASKTSDLATETAEDVRSGVRPVLIDAAGRAAPTLSMDGSVDVGKLTVLVGNAGRGPALNVYAYAFVASKAFAKRTPGVIVGNVAPDGSAMIELREVPSVDTSGSMESYLALRVVCVYSDLAARRHHTVIRLSDPGQGQRRPAGGSDEGGGFPDSDPGTHAGRDRGWRRRGAAAAMVGQLPWQHDARAGRAPARERDPDDGQNGSHLT